MMSKLTITATALGIATLLGQTTASAQSANVITLTQTPCQFVETEGADHGYKSTSKADCNKINENSGADRIAKAQVLTLKPGAYTFKVTNKNVPYDLGFWLRGQGVVGRATLPSVSGGGLSTGTTKDYNITTETGQILFLMPAKPNARLRDSRRRLT